MAGDAGDDRARLVPSGRTRTTSVMVRNPLDDLTGCAGSCFCHPTAIVHRMLALFLMCMLGFGSYFCFDNPGALQREIKDAMDISTYQFANLYAWYSWPNVLLPIVGGYLMDSVFGIRIGTIIFAMFIILGQALFACGAFLSNYPLMQVGRFVFGIGGESLAVAQNTYAVSWFKGKELNMVFGFQLSIARVGSTVNFLLVGPLYHYFADR
jgi:MFS family permease